MKKTRIERKKIRQKRVRSKVQGTSDKPRLSVFKSNTNVYAQVIDDEKATTIASFDSRKTKGENMTAKAKEVGLEIAKLAKGKKIETVVFDRAGYIFTGVVKSLAEGAREGGLKF
jgi:large subunit ribosomal protein L18